MDGVSTHPTPENLLAFATGRLLDEAALEIEEHLALCSDCCQRLDDIPADSFVGRLRRVRQIKVPAFDLDRATLPTPDEDPKIVHIRVKVPAILNRLDGSMTPVNTIGSDESMVPAPAISIPGYEIQKELGRGGMGVVCLARQIALNRSVALKMILGGEMASAAALGRFRIEAEAVARLQHPGIVQIHEIGEHNGLPWFALEYCEGGSLDHKLAAALPDAKAAASLAEKLARAMEVAHRKGVVHRDLKPANVLLDANGEPKISDFGLAKLLDADTRTRTGSVMGTPSYMAPEQADGQGDRIGPATDVYALGAVLYECLTGKPPFRAATALETLDQIRRHEPVPPRSLNPQVPRDLETICLKCLQKEPGARYLTAEALADDLRCFQKNLPILAQPTGRLAKAAKWCRRNPAVAALIGAVFAVLIAGVAVSAHFAFDARARASDADKQACLAREKADEARLREAETRIEYQRAEDALALKARQERLRRSALDVMTSFVVDDLLEKQATLTVRQKDYLQMCLKLYEEYAAEAGATEEIRAGAAAAQHRVGAIRYRLGDPAAVTAYADAIAARRQLAADYPRNPDHLRDLGQALDDLGMLHRDIGQFEKAVVELGEAVDILRQLFAQNPNLENSALLGRVLYHFGSAQEQAGNLMEAGIAYAQGTDLLRKVLADSGEQWAIRGELSMALLYRGLLDEKAERYKIAEDTYREAIGLLQKHAETPSGEHARLTGLARCQTVLGSLALQINQPEAALKALTEAQTLFSALSSAFPNLPAHRQDLGNTLIQLGLAYATVGRVEDGAQSMRSAFDLFCQLAKESKVPDYRYKAARAAANLGKLLARMKRPNTEVEKLHREVVERTKSLVDDFPAVMAYQTDHALAQQNLAYVLFGIGQIKEAETLYRGALAMWEHSPNLASNEDEKRGRAWCHGQLGTLLTHSNRAREGEPLLSKAVELWEQLHATMPDHVISCFELGTCQIRLAGIYLYSNRVREADAALRASLPQWERLIANPGPDIDLHRELMGDTLCTIGQITTFADKKPKDSLEWFAKALAVLDKLPAERQRSGIGRDYLMNALEGRATTMSVLGRHAEVVQDLDRLIELCPPEKKVAIRLWRTFSLARSGKAAAAFAETETLAGMMNTPQFHFELARAYAITAGVAGNDMELVVKAIKRSREQLDKLRAAGASPERLTEMLSKDPDFAAIRDRPATKKGLLADAQ